MCERCQGTGYERMWAGGGTVCAACGGSGARIVWCVWCSVNVGDGHVHQNGPPTPAMIRIQREDAAQLRAELESDARDEVWFELAARALA